MIKILFLASNPEGTSTLKLDEEIRSITEKIKASDYRDTLELVSMWAVRPDDLLEGLLVHKPQIVHFSGHGNSAGEIILMDDSRQAKPVSAAALRSLFSTLKDNIRLVMLNACYSHMQARSITKAIDCVVGMTTEIGDEAAIIFAASFYRAIGFGRTVREAFELGKAALLLQGIPEASTPQLLTRQGVDASSIFLVEAVDQIRAPTTITAELLQPMPPRLRDLLNLGSHFIDIPFPEEVSAPGRPKNRLAFLYFELKMRETKATFVVRVASAMNIGEAADYLARLMLPDLYRQGYEWSMVVNGAAVPAYHTFTTVGIQSGDTAFLIGNHSRPMVQPCAV